MSELDLVRDIAARATRWSRAIQTGIGDDCAVLRTDAQSELVFTTDFTLEGRHFTRATHTAAQVGQLALGRSLSDLAAMGSQPLFCLVSIAVPQQDSKPWLKQFYNGFLRLAEKHRVTLAGGDLSTLDTIAIDVMCCGRVPAGKALLRSGARAGDGIYVTGRLGKPRKLPQPRIREGISLRGTATAAMDLSDGLSLDLHRLCLASHTAAELQAECIPLARGASLESALYAGEDYELLFTAKASHVGQRIGTIKRGVPGEIRLDGRVLKPQGWDPFRNDH